MIGEAEVGDLWDKHIASMYEHITDREAIAGIRARFVADVVSDPEKLREVEEFQKVYALIDQGDVVGAERLALRHLQAAQQRARERCARTTHLDSPCGPYCLLRRS